jgi:hypothetical protein
MIDREQGEYAFAPAGLELHGSSLDAAASEIPVANQDWEKGC